MKRKKPSTKKPKAKKKIRPRSLVKKLLGGFGVVTLILTESKQAQALKLTYTGSPPTPQRIT